MNFISNKGGSKPVDFETAILDGFASDGGLYVPKPPIEYHYSFDDNGSILIDDVSGNNATIYNAIIVPGIINKIGDKKTT